MYQNTNCYLLILYNFVKYQNLNDFFYLICIFIFLIITILITIYDKKMNYLFVIFYIKYKCLMLQRLN